EVPMLVSCWSTKGGAGTSVVAASLAVLLAARDGDGGGGLLVDLTGDAAAALGHGADGPALGADGPGPGAAGWLAAAPDVPPDALGLLEVPVGAGLSLLPRGRGRL